MDSREKILSAVKKNQPLPVGLPAIPSASATQVDPIERFKSILVSIGGAVIDVKNYDQLHEFVKSNFSQKRIVSTIGDVAAKVGESVGKDPSHTFENVGLAIIPGHFGVAENGAVWVTDELMGDRALPFICEHLALVISRLSIVATMHEAYRKIGDTSYSFGTFIAGPSKTADIEQSLVLGAHGAKSLVVFLMDR